MIKFAYGLSVDRQDECNELEQNYLQIWQQTMRKQVSASRLAMMS